MEQTSTSENGQAWSKLSNTVRELMAQGSFKECETLIAAAMGRHPHSPQPHNLFGILFEKMGNRPMALKHFQAARALDPAYLPARRNLERFGSFYPQGTYVFDETGGSPERAKESVAAGPDRPESGETTDPAANFIKGAALRRAVSHGTATLIPFGEGPLYLAEVPIPPTAATAGKKIWETDLPPDVIIGCIRRGEQSIVPSGDTQILAGDVLILISAGKQEMLAIQKLTGMA